MKITVNVTARDIERGNRNSPWSCPVARAVKRTAVGREAARHGEYEVGVGAYELFIGDDLKFAHSESVSKFVTNFDLGRPVEPFTFTVGE